MTEVPASTTNICAGLDLEEAKSFTPHQIALIAQLMARAAERSYRRGFQQGANFATRRPEDLPRDLHAWRYGHSTDSSPWADCCRVESSLSRLLTENPALRHLGFPDE